MGGKVCILTTVHSPFDSRIFHKQAKTLVKAGYDVTLIAPHSKQEVVDGIKIIALPKPRNRLFRILFLTFKAFGLALKQKADVFHFHDPELIPVMLLLRVSRRVPVIYDVHEDYQTSFLHKAYLPKWFRHLMVWIITLIEYVAQKAFVIILAERYYIERFPQGITILNYPQIREEIPTEKENSLLLPSCSRCHRVLYTGGVTEARGALIHANLVHFIPNLHVYLVGRCSRNLATRLEKVAEPHQDRLHLEGVGYHVPFERIRAYYTVGGWSAGLALFPPSEHYYRKELTKFFEYMMAGIPILASNFPVWREVVEGNQCGLCVDPLDSQQVTEAIKYLLEHPEEAQWMGMVVARWKRSIIGREKQKNSSGYMRGCWHENPYGCWRASSICESSSGLSRIACNATDSGTLASHRPTLR